MIAKTLSASAGLCPPNPLTRGSTPGPCWVLHLRPPIIGSRYHARHAPSFPASGSASGKEGKLVADFYMDHLVYSSTQ